MTDRAMSRPPETKPSDPTPRRVLGFLLNLVILAALLYIFLCSIGLFGAAFKLVGKEFSKHLIATTTNPVVGLMIGLLATSLIQSSSSTKPIPIIFALPFSRC